MNFEGYGSDPMDKDETELKLERVVFGDEQGFHDTLRLRNEDSLAHSTSIPEDVRNEGQDDVEDEEPEGLDDSALFFLDSAPSLVDVPALLPAQTSDEDEAQFKTGDKPAWVDSDDERIRVSLASNPKLRKLRIADTEDVINGRDYSKRLRLQFERLYPNPEWANPSAIRFRRRRRASDSSESLEAMDSGDVMSIESEELSVQPLAKLIQKAGNFTRSALVIPGHKRNLHPEVIDVHRTKDVGTFQPSSVTSLAFHPEHPLLLSSGPSSTLYLHHVSHRHPNPSTLLTTLHLRSTPLTTSLFLHPSGNKIFFSGRRRYFHIWNLDSGRVEKVSRVIGHGEAQRSIERFKLSPCGRWMGLVAPGRKGGGQITVLDATTCQWIAEVRVEGKGGVADFDWWGNGDGMLVIGKGGEVIEWDGQERRVIARWIDEGAVGITVVALGGRGAGLHHLGGSRWAAIGSSSGIVNIYDRRKWMNIANVPARPKPTKVFDQLTTPVSHLEFSPDGQVLCMASRWKRDALRLAHLPSCTIYRNWPTNSTPLGSITAVAWAPNSELMAVANEQGKVRLWEIRK